MRNLSTEMCPCCDAFLNSPITVKSHVYQNVDFPSCSLFNDLVIVSCINCEFSFVSNPPSKQELKEFYDSVYRSNPSPYKIDFTNLKPSPVDFRAMSQISLATNFTNFKPGDIFLDLGAGNGNSFQVAKSILREPTLVGVESSSSANKYYSEKLNVKVYSEIEEFKKQGTPARIILLSHSLEHFRFDDITSLLNQLGALLTEDGVCIIEVPNANLLKNRDFLINDSPHLLFFSPESLNLLVEKLNFKILTAQIVGHPINPGLITEKIIKNQCTELLLKILSKFQRLLDSSILTIDVSPVSSLYTNFSQNKDSDVIRILVSKKRMD